MKRERESFGAEPRLWGSGGRAQCTVQDFDADAQSCGGFFKVWWAFFAKCVCQGVLFDPELCGCRGKIGRAARTTHLSRDRGIDNAVLAVDGIGRLGGGQVIVVDAFGKFGCHADMAGAFIQIRIRDDGAAIALRAKDRKAVQQHAHHDGVAALAVNRFAQAGRRGVIVIGATVLQEMRIAIVQKRRSVLGILVVHRDDRALGGFRNR